MIYEFCQGVVSYNRGQLYSRPDCYDFAGYNMSGFVYFRRHVTAAFMQNYLGDDCTLSMQQDASKCF